MHPRVLAALRCPICRGSLAATATALRCPAGHAFDVAREGYVSFLVGRGSRLVGDDAAMVAARARFLGAGHFAPLADAIAERAALPSGKADMARNADTSGEADTRGSDGGAARLVLEVGAGTAYYLARAVDAVAGSAGLAVDLSKHAARRAARAHPRIGAAVADARGALPVADGCAALVLDVFAPRNTAELRRVVRDDGVVLVVTPTPEHLGELRARLGLLDVDPRKERRLGAAFDPYFELIASAERTWTMALSRADVLAVAAMGPSARHLDTMDLAARVAAFPEELAVTAAVQLAEWRPRVTSRG